MKTRYFLVWEDEMNVMGVIAAQTTEELRDKFIKCCESHFDEEIKVNWPEDLEIGSFQYPEDVTIDFDEDVTSDITVHETWLI